jgi:hypothetical protein
MCVGCGVDATAPDLSSSDASMCVLEGRPPGTPCTANVQCASGIAGVAGRCCPDGPTMPWVCYTGGRPGCMNDCCTDLDCGPGSNGRCMSGLCGPPAPRDLAVLPDLAPLSDLASLPDLRPAPDMALTVPDLGGAHDCNVDLDCEKVPCTPPCLQCESINRQFVGWCYQVCGILGNACTLSFAAICENMQCVISVHCMYDRDCPAPRTHCINNNCHL